MPLPIFYTEDKDLQLLQTGWSTQLNPVLSNPSLKSIILPNIVLAIGSNVINHRLGRKLQGYRVVRQRALASLYDNQDSNQSPALTLILVSDAVVTIDLEVF